MTQTNKKIIDKLPKKNKKIIHIFSGLILVTLIIIVIACSITQRTYNSYSVIDSKPRTDSMTKG